MAGKESTIFIIDLGATIGRENNGRTESDLEYGLRYIWDKITTVMLANRKTLSVGVIGFRTDVTRNNLDEGAEYADIEVIRELEAMDMPSLIELQRRLVPNQTVNGDALSALAVAIEMMMDATKLKTGKPEKCARKIILLTDGMGAIEGSDIDQIAARVNECEITLVVIGVDFDDLEFGFKEEDKPEHKRENEKILKSLVDQCSEDSLFATAAEAIEQLSIPKPKATRPYASYKGQLTLGNPVKYPDTAVAIDVERYFRTKAAAAPTASSFTLSKAANNARPSSQQSSHTVQADTDKPNGTLVQVKQDRKYQVNDPYNDENDGKKDLDRDDLEKGYEYGRSIVPIGQSDANVTDYGTQVGFEILGFIPWDKYERFLCAGESSITIAQPTNEKAVIALSSIIRALHELESYAIARIVTKAGKEPQLLLLAPLIEPDLEAFIDVPLPFAEDVRIYRFAPLDRVFTTSGNVIKENHRNLPKPPLMDAMSEYVDSMDLSEYGKDDEGNPTEYMRIEETFSPTIHRIQQAIRRRAVKQEEGVQRPADVLMQFSKPPQKLVEKRKPELDALIKAAELITVPPKVKGKRGRKDEPQPLSGLDIDALLNSTRRAKRQKISPENAIPEFKQRFADDLLEKDIALAGKEMAELTLKLIRESNPRDISSKLEQALSYIVALRDKMLNYDSPATYNEFMYSLKKIILADTFPTDGREFLFKLKKASSPLGLIVDSLEKTVGGVTEDDAQKFWSIDTELPDRS